MAASDDPLYPIAILIDELKNEDIALRLNSVRRLSTIAVALDTERTRSELIPFLLDSLDDEEDVLVALADELGKFVQYVGGPSHAYVLLEPLVLLASVEEPVVREHAVESLRSVALQMSPADIRAHMVPALARLAQGDWQAARCSAAALVAHLYPLLAPLKPGMPSSEREQLMLTFGALCQDVTAVVRRSAYTAMAVLVANVQERSVITQHVLPMFTKLARDDQDSVRLLAIDAALALARAFSQNNSSSSSSSSGNSSSNSSSSSNGPAFTQVVSTIKMCGSDAAWRVRYVVADKFAELGKALPMETFRSEVLSYFVRLLKDTEAEVRTAAANRLADVLQIFSASQGSNPPAPSATPTGNEFVLGYFTRDVLPACRELVVDPSQHVRAALAGSLPIIAPVLGRALSLEHLFPLIMALLRDDFHEVRLNLLSKLDAIQAVVGVDALSQSLLPAVVDLAEDKQWRVRLATVDQLPLLAAQLGRPFFDDKLMPLLLQWLSDVVFSVREAAVEGAKTVAEKHFGTEWAHSVLVPRASELLAGHQNYLHRMTLLFLIRSLAPILGARGALQNETSFRPIIALLGEKLSRDPVPNVRFNVARTLGALLPYVSPVQATGKVRPVLERLRQDADVDVQFYAEQAITQSP
eukprot:ANDGO_05066.mRNA.1 Serine/threonine-protein phosphatase 2A 65 kDa regulatory subunit A beta isoform